MGLGQKDILEHAVFSAVSAPISHHLRNYVAAFYLELYKKFLDT